MRRAWWLAPLAGVVLTGVLVLATAGLSAKRAEEAKKETSKSPTAGQLPIAQVVLFSSGVGYFQREGRWEGSHRPDLPCRTSTT